DTTYNQMFKKWSEA
ncbi:TPA: hypothetical protein I2076_RS12700, partial [Staphylococcus aureus]|nr:hypothetical protein [Staphylococcus aureus]HBI9131092.1 hypothetical protein [Staphylococcus aureus]HBI9310128.1 hypothetical protein [Staphylococcus aureus]HDE3533601.1 hypothetical protein [Staphylococcus aureus]HDE5027848.1 hypothetical protein [Staphylococcus aureus]